MSAEQTPDIAQWLGDMDESRNVFDVTDEATTVISIDVEVLAERFAPVLDAAVREAEQRAWSEGYEAGGEDATNAYWGTRHDRSQNPYRADRITEPVSHEAAASGEEASKA